MTALTKTLAATSLLLTVGAISQLHLLHRQRAETLDLIQRSTVLDSRITQLRDQRDRTLATFSSAQILMEPAQPRSGKRPNENSELGAWLGRVSRLEQALKQNPARRIPEMKFLNSNDWLSVTMDNPLDTDAKIRGALSKLREMAKMKPQVATNLSNALQAYRRANDGRLPSDSTQLQQFLNPPLPDELLRRYEPAPEIAGENDANGLNRDGMRVTGSGRVVLQEKTPVDEDYDTWFGFTEKGGWCRLGVSRLGKTVSQAMGNYTRANNGQIASTPEELIPYLPIPTEPVKLKEYWDVGRH